MGAEGCSAGDPKSGLTNRTQKVPHRWFLSRNWVRSVAHGVSKVMVNKYKYQVCGKLLLRCRNTGFLEVAEAHLDMVFTAPTQLWQSELELLKRVENECQKLYFGRPRAIKNTARNIMLGQAHEICVFFYASSLNL